MVVWTLFSAVVGAGFATGQELLPFVRECTDAPAAAAMACLLTGWLAWNRAMRRGCGPGGPGSAAPPWPVGWAGRAAALAVSWIALTAMEAALAHLLEGLLGPALSLVVAAALVGLGAMVPAASGLGRLSAVLGPFMAASLTATGLWVDLQPAEPATPLSPGSDPRAARPGEAAARTGAPRPAAGQCALRILLYASANGLFAERPLRAVAAGLPAGGSGTGHGALLGLWGGGLLGFTAAIGVWVMGRTASSGEVMPLVASAAALHPAARVVYSAAVAASAYTTAVAAAVGLAGDQSRARTRTARVEVPQARRGPRHPGGCRCPWRRLGPGGRAVAWVALGIPVAGLGFAEAVQRLYPWAGWAALAALTAESLFAALRRRGLY